MNDDLLRLMTAAVDGELTPAETLRLERELAESPEARLLFDRLKADSARLRTLPAVPPPENLQRRILALLAQVPAPIPTPARRATQPTPNGRYSAPRSEPATPAPTRPAPRRHAWVPFAVAAAMLVCVTTGSFLFFVNQNEPRRPGRGGDRESAKWLPDRTAPRPSSPVPDDNAVAPDREPVPPGPGEVPPVRPPAVPDHVALAPEPRTVRPDLHAFPPLPVTAFDLVQVRVPFLKAVADFGQNDVRDQFAEELGRDPAFRIDLFARDPVRGVEAFQAAAKAAGVNLFADATTLDRLKKQRQNNSVVVYTDSLTAPELAALFGKLQAEDAKYSPRIFDALHAVPADGRDSDELRKTFGVDVGLFKRALDTGTEQGEKNPTTGTSISDGTADEIVKSVTSREGKGGAKKDEKHAALMTWAPVTARTPPASSAELKRFLDKRGPRRADVVPALIVIRSGTR